MASDAGEQKGPDRVFHLVPVIAKAVPLALSTCHLRDLRLRVVGRAYFFIDTFAKIRAALRWRG